MGVNTYKEDEELKASLKVVTLKRLYAYLFKYKKDIVVVLLYMAIIIGVSVINPLLIEKAVNDYIDNKNVQGLLIIGAVAIVLNSIFLFCLKRRMRRMAKISNNVLLTIRQELYSHIQKLSFGFFDNRPVGKILARVIGDVNSLKDVLTNSVITLIPDFLTISAVMIIMFVKNYRLAFAALATLPLVIAGMYVVQVLAHRRWQVFRKKNSNLNAYTHEDFSGIRIVQSFSAEQDTSNTFEGLLTEQRGAFISAVKLSDMFGGMIEISWGVGTALLYWIAINMVGNETIQIGTIVAFSTYLGMFWGPIRNLSNFYNQLVTNLAGAERIFEILDIEPDITDASNANTLPPINGEVIFENVTFSYDEQVNVLNDVSFKIKSGETIALVGPTGAGKTTVINLVSRFYDVQEGKVLIDGIDVKDVNLESLRGQMGIMTQDNFLFSTTVKENIRYGKLDATDEEVIEAAKAVHAHDFIMKLEKGYDTEVNERGSRLSIGQRQLLAFARTMISKPRILILDEATSSIDTHTERLVQQGIEVLLKGRTSFVIAHRLSTIQKADRIFVVDQGKILEEGNHSSLMEKKGLYYELFMAQFKSIEKND